MDRVTETNDGPAIAVDPLDQHDVVVLLVDDQPIIGEMIRRAVADESNIDLHYCSNPLDAVRMAERIKPTVILQDLVMPDIDGMALVRQYRSTPSTKDIPIIVLSSTEEPTMKREAFASGANDYLVKVPEKVELIARIRYHSTAYLNGLQRDAAYSALRESQHLLLEKNIELERLSNLDGLTGLSNRRSFADYISLEWGRATRERTPISLLMIDVDDFKSYNDTYGHLAGDDVLKALSATVRSCCKRSTDIAARFGGEEFVVSLAVPIESARDVAEWLRAAVVSLGIPNRGSTVAEIVTISIGIAATIPLPDESYFWLLEEADSALYTAKQTGKNRVVLRPYAA